ncbi:MAG: hypothetical protein HC868_15750, partial [Sphingomonadales bacterium]|nr:hypothetical protein [Sphingomonadales bacterium]
RRRKRRSNRAGFSPSCTRALEWTSRPWPTASIAARVGCHDDWGLVEDLPDSVQEQVRRGEIRAVVTAVPDERKGERLVLLTQEKTATRDALLRHAKLKGAAELSVPAEIMIVDAVPLLGSGKPDYVTAKEQALKRAAPAAAEAGTVAA